MILISTARGEEAVSFGPTGLAAALSEALATCAPGAPVGIIAETGAPLLIAWQVCLARGLVPVILQRPTAKLSRLYWRNEIALAIDDLGLQRLICQTADDDPGAAIATVVLDRLPGFGAPADAGPARPAVAADAHLIQLSSGTTGHRKGVGLAFGDVVAHIGDYNRVLGLGPDDCIVSWLPLYHDMGFVAAYLAAQIVGCRLVLVDPMRWVGQPELLLDLIERHRGSICFMPNFAFEVMARRARPRPLPSMRRWISCSEPTRAETMTRFMATMGTSPEQMANCYGMAENIFAVAQSNRFTVAEVGGRSLVSCGPPIPNTEIRIVDGEICIRSPYSLRGYLGGATIADADGFYPSGDLGFVRDGEVYITGRRHDVVNVAGQKFMLSDIDRQLDVGGTGRIASFGRSEAALGTETITSLIEDPMHWVHNRDVEARAALARRTGAETAQVHYVPPRFITKTSSGKVNRIATADHWTRNLRHQQRQRDGVPEHAGKRIELEIRDAFPALDLDRPIGEQLDSLGVVNLSIILSRSDPEFFLDPDRTVASYLGARAAPAAQAQVINIVSFCDYEALGVLLRPAFESITQHFGLPIHFRHIALPPAKIVLSDLIFADYFMSRDDRLSSPDALLDCYGAVLAQQRVLRNASLILADDLTHYAWPTDGVGYPMLSHDFVMGEHADVLAVRWQRYTELHHRLAYRVLGGADLPPEEVETTIWQLGDYLDVPIVRIAFDAAFHARTAHWEVQCPKPRHAVFNRWPYHGDPQLLEAFARQLTVAIQRALTPQRLREGEARSYIEAGDIEHWCAWQVNPALIDFILERYDDVLVLGRPASAPYIQRQASRLGKRLTYRPTLETDGDFDCVVQLGSWGHPKTDKPLFVVMADNWTSEVAHNVPDDVRRRCPRATLVPNGGPAYFHADSPIYSPINAHLRRHA